MGRLSTAEEKGKVDEQNGEQEENEEASRCPQEVQEGKGF